MRSKKKFILFNTMMAPVVLALIFQINFGVPKILTLFENEEYNYNLPSVLYADCENINKDLRKINLKEGTYRIPLKLFGIFTVKTVSVNVTHKSDVIPMGNAVGIKMHSDGPMVVGFETFKTENGEYSITNSVDIKTGDRIVSIDNEACENTKAIIKKMAKQSGRPMTLGIIRGGRLLTIKVTPKFDVEAKLYRLGIWLRDSTAGIGTLTFVIPGSLKFAALGHGITDVDTGYIVDVSKGKIVNAGILKLKKGKPGEPGELRGCIIGDSKPLGDIEHNTTFGVFGTMDKSFSLEGRKPIPIASRNQVKEGAAHILCCIEGSSVEEFEIEIIKTDPGNVWGSKGIVIKVTDPALLEKTGGIVQGMSGSPIIQNGRLAGAVTHVFIGDPTKGYGIYTEDMLSALLPER